MVRPKPPGTRRPRPTTACIQCRSRRIKCDREKPICSECKRQGRSCDTPQDTVSHHIMLDRRVEIVTARRESILLSEHDGTTESSESGKTTPQQGISLSPFWMLAHGDAQIQKDISWIHKNIIPKLEAESAPLDHETKEAFSRCMPSQEECKSLIQSFLLSINPLVPLGIDTVSIEDLLVYKTNLLVASSPHLLSLVIAVLYSGAVAAPTVLAFEQMRMMHTVYERLLKTIESSPFSTTASTLQFLQGYLLINTARGSRGDPSAGYGFVASAIRKAQSIKSYISPKLDDPLQIQINSQIWWYLDFLDVEGTLATGIPGLIQPEGDVYPAPPTMCAFSKMANTRMAANDYPQHTSSMATATRGRHELAKKLQKWIKSAPCDEDVAKFVATINTLLETIPETPDTEWPRLYLSLQIDRMWCIYQRQPSELSLNCEDSTIRSARAFLEKYYRLSTLLSNPNYQWYLPGLSQPLHALMIVLTHLCTCLNLAAETNLGEIVDKIFGLRVLRDSRDASVVTRAIVRRNDGLGTENPMYCLLWNLRRRAWEKAGWEIPLNEQLPILQVPAAT